MDKDQIIVHARRILSSVNDSNYQYIPQIVEFLRVYAGEKSAFYKNISKIDHKEYHFSSIRTSVRANLQGFIGYLESGLSEGVSIERKAQIDVVSDILSQAQSLLDSKGINPAAPVVLIGAALEEFLRNWMEESGISLGEKKPGIDTYTKLLKEKDLITKQDDKDITSWAGLRNHAAHGEWDQVSDINRVKLMLEGVNLFMRKYGRS
jgi:preprotein translocase subunit Sss1